MEDKGDENSCRLRRSKTSGRKGELMEHAGREDKEEGHTGESGFKDVGKEASGMKTCYGGIKIVLRVEKGRP